jgi:hypothetical protein
LRYMDDLFFRWNGTVSPLLCYTINTFLLFIVLFLPMGPKRSFIESIFKQWSPNINDIVNFAKLVDHQRGENVVEATYNLVF